MSVRSLPHFAHSPIGKTTHKKGMSYAHVNYITRDDACSKTLAQNMPADRSDARPYFEREARKDGVPANARIADTLIIALPLELSPEQRHEAIQTFMEKLGKGRIAWIAAFHDKGKDEANPHCHIIFRDADIETGRKVVGTTTSSKDVKEATEKGWRVPPRMTTKDMRVAWCEHLNAEMERHGLEARFDHRSLKEQGIDRQAEIHVGPKAMSMAKKDRDFLSQDRSRGDHANVYTLLDAGSRADYNKRIAEANQQREADKAKERVTSKSNAREGQEKRALRETQSAERKAMYQDQSRDRAALRAAQDSEKLEHLRWGRKLYAEARERAFQEIKQQNGVKWKDIHKIADARSREAAAQALKAQQKFAYADAAAKQIDKARPIKNEAWHSLKHTQETERRALQQRHAEETAALSRQHIAERLALHERWQHQHQTKQANRVNAKLEAHQGMAAVQSMAVRMINHHAKTGHQQSHGNPFEAAKHFGERAKAEQAARGMIRDELFIGRESNQSRGASRSGNERERTRYGNDASRAQAQQQTDKQNDIRQTAASGRTLSSAEQANASPEAKAAISSKETTRKISREEQFLQSVRRASDKGRSNGGRSGR